MAPVAQGRFLSSSRIEWHRCSPFEVTPSLLYSVRIADARCGRLLLRFLYHFRQEVLRFLLRFFLAPFPRLGFGNRHPAA